MRMLKKTRQLREAYSDALVEELEGDLPATDAEIREAWSEAARAAAAAARKGRGKGLGLRKKLGRQGVLKWASKYKGEMGGYTSPKAAGMAFRATQSHTARKREIKSTRQFKKDIAHFSKVNAGKPQRSKYRPGRVRVSSVRGFS